MITSEKIKLLINDPKFRQMKDWSIGSRQQALNKIYANQKQIHRAKVVQQCLVKKQLVGNVDTTVDFLHSKIRSVQSHIVEDIHKTLSDKQTIQQKYRELQDIYDKANAKYTGLISSIGPEIDFEHNINNIQRQINQIKELYEENIFLKNLNNQIKKRIKEKHQKNKVILPVPTP